MNIFNKITLQSMRKSPTRTVVTVIGVVLSAAMITAVATFCLSLQNYMVRGAAQKYGSWQVEFLDVGSAFAQERALDKGVANAAVFEHIGYGALKGGKNPEKPYLFIAGFSKEAFHALPITLLSGRLPENSGEILVPAHVAANGGVKFSIGDTVSLALGDRMEDGRSLGQHDPYISGKDPGKAKETLVVKAEKTYRVVGICQRPSFEEYSAPGYTLITTEGPTGHGGRFSVFVTLSNPRQVHAYASATAGGHSYVFNDELLRFMGLSQDHMFHAILYWVGGVLVALIIIGSILLIYNSFNISLNERIRQLGILSSVGATAKQLVYSVLFEGLCIGAAGIPIGVIVGIGSIRVVLGLVAKNFSNILYSGVPLTLTLSIPAIMVAVAVSMVTILISAYLPARKAARTPVMESIRQTNQVKICWKDVKTSKIAEGLYGLEGTLAFKNFKRNKKRYGSIVLSLTLSLVLFVSASAFGMYLKQAAKQSVADVDYDICFTTQDMDEGQVFRLYDELKTADGVYHSSYQAMMAYSCAVKAKDLSSSYRKLAGLPWPEETVHLPMDIQFIKDDEYLGFIKELGLSPKEYTGKNPKMVAVAKAKGYDKKTGKSALDNVFAAPSMVIPITPETVKGAAAGQGKKVTLTFVDTMPLDPLPKDPSAPKSTVFTVVAPYGLRGKFKIPGGQEELGLTFRSKNPSKSSAQMETMIQREGITSPYHLYNVNKMFEQNRNIIFVVHVFTYVFVLMISLIGIANVFNTISTNIRLRRRELAMLRSVGMSDGDFKKMMNFECAFYGIRTLLFGIPMAGILSWLIYKGMAMGGLDTKFAFPWPSFGISVLGVFLVVFITMVYAIGKIRRENIIDALRDDMT